MTTPIAGDYDYYYDYGDEYMYPGYNFERAVYLYVWEILVVITCLQNFIILSVFLRRKMRNPTNFILSAIAISDTLTGLVTLPSYIMVFQRYDPLKLNEGDNGGTDYILPHNNTSVLYSYDDIPDIKNTDNFTNQNNSDIRSSNFSDFSYISPGSVTPSTTFYMSTFPPVDGYILTKNLCRVFMISKYFFSKSFHTISIFLTIFLEIQRYISMAHPYRYETCFNRFRIVKIYCLAVFIFCPLLHSFHLGSDKAMQGLCQWELSEAGCGGGCIYLWTAFVLRHFIPSLTMVIFTVLFIRQLKVGEKKFRRMDSNASQVSKRVHENRRISLVVTAIVVIRLVPEIPYSIFLLYNSIDKTVNNGEGIDIEANRLFHMIYEIALVVSFITNFYIYIIFNKSFRKQLHGAFIAPVKRTLDNSVRFNEFATSLHSRRSTKRAESLKPGIEFELKTFNSAVSNKLARIEPQTREQ